MRLWQGPAATRPNRDKYMEAKLFRDRMQAQADSLERIKDTLQADLERICDVQRRHSGFIAEHSFAHINELKDTVIGKYFLLIDSTGTAVTALWPEEEFVPARTNKKE